VPVFDAAMNLLAVLDIDSDKPDTFDDVDRKYLEELMTWFVRPLQPPT